MGMIGECACAERPIAQLSRGAWERLMWCWRNGMACAAAAFAVAIAGMIGLPSGSAFAESFRIDNVDRAARINMRQTPNNKAKIVAYVPPDAVLTGTGKCDAK